MILKSEHLANKSSQNVVKYHSHFGHSTFEWSPDITVKYIHTKKDQLMFALVPAVESQTTEETWFCMRLQKRSLM